MSFIRPWRATLLGPCYLMISSISPQKNTAPGLTDGYIGIMVLFETLSGHQTRFVANSSATGLETSGY